MTSCQKLHNNNGHIPILYPFGDKRRFQSKTGKFLHPRVFNVPYEWVPIRIRYRRSGSKTYDGTTGLRKEFDDIFSILDTIIHKLDGETDGQIQDDSIDRIYA